MPKLVVLASHSPEDFLQMLVTIKQGQTMSREGTRLIGSSWTACFLAHGLDVVATDPAPGAEDKVRQHVEGAWAGLTKIGLSPRASTSRVRFEPDLKEAVADADLVQENAPEREPVKIKLSRISI